MATPSNTGDRDRIRTRRVVSDRSLRYLHYVPRAVTRQDLVLVTVHGISRNAAEHARAFQPLANRLGCHLLAPWFDRRTFRHFQRLGLGESGRRADHALQAMLADLCRFGVDADARIVLCGYSGGAQFAHRYALFHPQRIVAMLIAAAGWYTLPDANWPFPRGCRAESGRGVVLDPGAWLTKPMLVLVGEHDDRRDEALRREEWIDREQGRTRIERARTWVGYLSREAARQDRAPCCEFGVLGGAGHDFEEMVAAGMVRRFESFLYSRPDCGVICRPIRDQGRLASDLEAEPVASSDV